jgi:hypothetical protein
MKAIDVLNAGSALGTDQVTSDLVCKFAVTGPRKYVIDVFSMVDLTCSGTLWVTFRLFS